MFKYEYGQLPDTLNMFFVKNGSVHNYNTRNRDKRRPAIAKHAYRDKYFRLVGVHVWNYICDNINIVTSFASLKIILKKIMFYLIWYWFFIASKTTVIKLINWCRTGNGMHIKTYDLYFSCYSIWYTLNKLYCF